MTNLFAVHEVEPGRFVVAQEGDYTSTDGERRAPLATIVSESWSPRERADFNIHLVEPASHRPGERIVSARFERVDGVVKNIVETAPIPAPPPPIRSQLDNFGQLLDVMVEAGAVTVARAATIKTKLKARAGL